MSRPGEVQPDRPWPRDGGDDQARDILDGSIVVPEVAARILAEESQAASFGSQFAGPHPSLTTFARNRIAKAYNDQKGKSFEKIVEDLRAEFEAARQYAISPFVDPEKERVAEQLETLNGLRLREDERLREIIRRAPVREDVVERAARRFERQFESEERRKVNRKWRNRMCSLVAIVLGLSSLIAFTCNELGAAYGLALCAWCVESWRKT